MSDPVPAAAPAPATPPAPLPVLVKFDRVAKSFPGPGGRPTPAIDGISFKVEDLPGKGEFIVIMGPSGCGKSTVLKLIAGLEPAHPATSGEVTVYGAPVPGPGPDRGMVFQSYSSFPCYTVLENVAFGLKMRGVGARERERLAREWVKKVHLGGSEHRYPHQLSGGMRQRVAIARTLALKPRIILMDEPFGALDRVTRWEMQDLLVELWREVEATVFLVTHDVAEGVYLGDRMYVMTGSPGTIAEEVPLPAAHGEASEVQRTAWFAERVNEISRKIERVKRDGA